MDASPAPDARTRKKPSYPIGADLRDYLKRYRRERELPVTYERLRRFADSIPLNDSKGKPTLWESVFYDRLEMESLQEDLKRVYALIRVDGDLSVMKHLYIDRIDFCAFGNSTPFRIRIVNAYNDNPDYFYIKRGDASTTLLLAARLLDDPEDLMHKAVGWMLRETGKRVDRALLLGFLDEHAARMPRTMLAYATEHLDAETRAAYRAVPRARRSRA